MKLTQEHKNKIRDAMMGKKHHLGFKHSEEAKQKMRVKKLGHRCSEETKRKMSVARKQSSYRISPRPKGYKVSKEGRENMRLAHLGDKSNLWQGGKSKLTSLIRESFYYKDWRKSIYERDGFTCVFCKKIGGQIQADHIKPFSQILQESFEKFDLKEKTIAEKYSIIISNEELWNLNNGRTLCVSCHKTTDTYGKKAKQINFNRRKF